MEQQASFVRKSLIDQVAEHLLESIKSEDFLEGPAFLSSRLLAKEYGVSHNVMLKVLGQLHVAGVLQVPSRRRGYKVNKQLQLQTE